MIPAGGAHVKHPECARAARLLGVDYADAVTGFAFKGRHGTAIINGAVVAAEYALAVQEIIGGFAIERIQAEEARKTQQALRLWRRFMAGLRIRERIEGYSVEGEGNAVQEATAEDESMSYESGGFFPTGEVEDIAEPTAPGSVSRTPQHPNGSLSIGSFAKGAGTARDNSLGAQSLVDGPSPRSDHTDGRFDDKLNPDAEEPLDDNDHPTPHVEIVYGKSLLSEIGDIAQGVEAGGFMTEDNIETHEAHIEDNEESIRAGGFLTEDDPETHRAQSKRRIDDAFAPSNLADDDLDQATMLQQTFESRQNVSDRADDEILRTTPVQAVVDQLPSTVPGSHAQNHTSGSDEGSLLSEDPDDEDAEPEWLV